jgi:hypothetical protein
MMNHHRPARWAAAAGLAVIVVGLSSPPVMARPVPGGASPTPAPTYSDYLHCPLERVGTQYVRCDSFTGAGVPAAPWIPVLGSGMP